MKYVTYLLLLLGRAVMFPLYWLVGLFPRRQDIWVFGSWGGHRFADNAAAFFVYSNTVLDDQVRLVWISRDKKIVRQLRVQGYNAYWIWSVGGITNSIRAGLHIFDCFPKDANFWLSRGAIKVNLWSGVPLKVFERDIDHPGNRYYKLFHGNFLERTLLSIMMPWHVVKPDMIIATSAETARITSRAFALFESQTCVTGFPRNDALVNPAMLTDYDAQNIPEEFREAALSDTKVFLYLPTFRDNGAAFINFDWEALNKRLERLDAKLFFKTHPVDKTRYPANYPNITQLPVTTEIYSLLPGTDALISDYSSIIFDYMLLNKPIIYYVPDLEEFEAGCRSFNFRPKEVAVGPVCMNFRELGEALEQCAFAQTNIIYANRDEVMRRLHKYCDAGSSNRVMREILARYGNGQIQFDSHIHAQALSQPHGPSVVRLPE